MSLTAAFSTSMQNPVDGWLVGGVPLPLKGRGYRFNPHKDPRRRYGTVELVQALVRAAGKVEDAHPGGELTINDIAMPAGGEIGGHASHRNGRDVDVMFYLVGPNGQPFPSKSIPIEPNGTGFDYRDLSKAEDDIPVKLDVARTWAFVSALVGDPGAHINRIFVVEHVRAMLLAHAEKIGAPGHIVERFGHVTCQPKFPHDDHFHIRFFCAIDDIAEGCEDTFPIYPWHEAHLADAGVQVRLAKARPKKKKPKLTSVKDAANKARNKYGKLHAEVEAFLERRKEWVDKPHPGRPFCE
jgi:penicillin-insensitive murein endopeptidase